MKRTAISQVLIDAQKAFNKASKALPEYAALRQAKEASDRRDASVKAAQRALGPLVSEKVKVSAEQLSLFRQAGTLKATRISVTTRCRR